MSSIPISLGVQSYCFREFSNNADVAQQVRILGLDQIEICAKHANFNDTAAWRNIVSLYADHGISIVSIGVQTFQGADEERSWFECAAMAGARHISAHVAIGTYAKAIEKMRVWSREFGIRVGLHCHGGYAFGGSPDVMRHLIEMGSPEIGLCLDTAWAMQIGPDRGNPVRWINEFGEHLYGIHLKDFIFERNGKWQDTIIGEGTLDLPALLEALQQCKFDGIAILEYEANPCDPVPELTRCVHAIRDSLRTGEV